MAIAGATPGKPSLPKDLVLQTAVPWSPPQSDILVTKLGPWKQPAPWYTPKAGWVDGKLPPSGAMPAADASGDTAPTSGPVPGVDAQSGWTDAVSPQATAPATAKASDDGCRAAPQGPMRSTVLALAVLVLAVIWSRRRHGA
jgi:MYXO-CTERM domain-containing protein